MTEITLPSVDIVNDRFFGNPLNEFSNGVMLDMRAKLAVEFLKADLSGSRGSAISVDVLMPPTDRVKYALDLADALLEESARRGYLQSMPASDALPVEFAESLKLNARASIAQQVFGQEIAQEMAPRVAPAMGPLNGGRR